MTPALLANENFPAPDIRELRLQKQGAKDTEVLTVAREQSRWLLTFDRDYGELIFSKGHAPSPVVVYLRQGPYALGRAAELTALLLATWESHVGYFIVLSEEGIRRRPLPQASG